MTADDLIGTWKLVSFKFQRSDGETTYPFGQDVAGFITYDAAGNLAVQVSRLDRPPFASGDMQDGTDDEIRAAYLGYIAYLGAYEVNEEGRYVSHHVRNSLFPNWKGVSQRRYFDLSGDRLTLTTPPIPFGGESQTGILKWVRVS